LEEITVAKELTMGLFERMGIRPDVEGFLSEGELHLEVRGDQESVLIGKHGRTLEALQTVITRMVNKRLKRPIRITLDIDDYRKRRAENMVHIAQRMGEKAKTTGRPQMAGPFNT
jgi:spoIIIJ-associated protein